MINAYFDTKAFINALDAVRRERNITWHQIWHQTGVQMSSMKKMRDGKRECSIHTLATLALWSGLEVTQFIKRY
jgi:DNA-binding Xre family transcriptional regulator